MQYCVRTTSALLASTRLTINGSPLNGTAVSPGTAQTVWCRSAITNATAGDVVNVQMFGLLGAATLMNPGGAEMVIERLADIIP
jgi:hypothetical protein